ncbi:MAG: Nudix family hydrolase [Ectothiorhodospiraceae bacterium]|nr:Nudix family hydrolase [Ectothiorhodospiraceae bacterium]
MPSTVAEGARRLPTTHVAVGVVVDSVGRVLISRRPDHVHQGGLWEFPGGKVEPEESVLQALDRELYEELGIRPTGATPLLRVPHDYGDKRVLLDVWRLHGFTGRPHGREDQPIRWVSPEELHAYRFPIANRPIVHAVSLPDQYLITPDPTDWDQARFLERLDARMAAGLSLIQLRGPAMSPDALRALTEAVIPLARRHGARVLLNADPGLARELGVGVHLNRHRLRSLSRRPLPEEFLVAASCHDGEELALAVRLGVDFAVLGPVAPTESHPGRPGLGLAGFRDLVRDCPLPVYALGGMDESWMPRVRAARGQGIAAIRALWRQPDPGAVDTGSGA